MVFQSYAIWPHMTVFDNVAFPLRVGNQKFSKAETQRKVEEALRVVELGGLEGRMATRLSGGQQQRLALARALVREPRVLLLDEPLSNLDAKLRVTMRAEIKRLQQRLGTTTLYVTHDQVEALTMADRVCLLSGGRIQQYAPPQDVFDRPANRFVAEFVGNPPMNVLEIALDPERGGVIAGSSIPLGDRYRACAAAGVSHVGVRARDLELVPAGTPGTVSGSVYVVEPLGDEVFVEVLLGDTRASVSAPRGFPAAPGRPIGERVDPTRACFFTPDGTTAVHRSSDSPIGHEVEGILS
jgi:multiple sugar transport system ATP-binding protein